MDKRLYDEQVSLVTWVTKLHEGFVIKAAESLFASEHNENALHVSKGGDIVIAGVN